jgi:hypothetical protein
MFDLTRHTPFITGWTAHAVCITLDIETAPV